MLRDRCEDLLFADFDTGTKWPVELPGGFSPDAIMKLGENPGLGVRKLHERGITGRGVGVAIIDQTLLVDHQEYAANLRLYEETDDIVGGWRNAQMHGAAVASIAVGRTVGVAPGADLYYIATARGGVAADDFSYLARCVRRIIQVNHQLPDERKIRVIAMAIGWRPKVRGFRQIEDACEEAKAAGMLLVSSSIERTHGFNFHGLGRSPLSDPDRFTSYEPGLFWAKSFEEPMKPAAASWYKDRLLVPMDSRTVASPCGTAEYAFYREGGWSWSIPYIAGLYALAAQVDPSITPARFWRLALATGETIQIERKGEHISFGPIVNPVELIEALARDGD